LTPEGTHRVRRRKRAGPGPAKLAAIVALALALAAGAVSITAAGVFRDLKPSWALRFAPWDARAQMVVTQRSLLKARGPAAIGAIGRQAARAYRRDPTALTSVTTLGFIAGSRGQEEKAGRIFRYAERLSRRDPETQLWLIEQSVKRDDVRGALVHYDTVLRSSPGLWPHLQPILISASSDGNIARELNRVLRARPNWSRDLLIRFADEGRDAVALATVSRGILDQDVDEDRLVLLRVLDRLVSLGRFDLAWAEYELATRAQGRVPPLLRDGQFRSERVLPPFDWDFADGGRLSPERRLRDRSGSSFALYLPVAASTEGEVARQLLRLEPGAYQLGAQVGEVPQDRLRRPFFKVACTGEPERRLLQADFPPATASGRSIASRFVVPAGCRNQWLSIWVRGDIDEALSISPWVTSISLRRL
jgi:hypothetical protein